MRPILLGLVLLEFVGCQSAAHPPATPPTPPAPFTDGVLEVGGGTSLHLHCVGAGTPVVVFEAGLGNDGSVWNDVLLEVAKLTRACVYDRAGMGYSSRPAPRPHGNRQMAGELYALLHRARIEAPYVFVAHSMGGVNVRLFASEHLDEVAGMVLVDTVTADEPSRYWALRPPAEMDEFRAGVAKLPEGLNFDVLVASIADMRASSQSIGDRPLIVLTRGKEDAPPGTPPERTAQMLRARQDLQSELPRLSTNSTQLTADGSRHYIQWDAPQLVAAAIRQVVVVSRTHGRVSASPLAPLAHTPSP
jgi:pimeloyl-ACP methyl ester carboxylesterase